MDKTNSTKQIKTILLYATIAVIVLVALIAIFMIFFGTTNTLLQVMSTLAVIYLTTLLSIHNISRLSEPHSITRGCAIAALFFNLFWSIPWILIIWGAFGNNYHLIDTIWRLLWSALIAAGYCTLLSTQLPQPSTWKGLAKVQNSIPLVLVSYILFNALVFVWIVGIFYSGDLIFKLICSELILLLLQWAIPEILIRNQRKQSSQEQNQLPTSNNSTSKASSSHHENTSADTTSSSDHASQAGHTVIETDDTPSQNKS